jgi:hypothetical protein
MYDTLATKRHDTGVQVEAFNRSDLHRNSIITRSGWWLNFNDQQMRDSFPAYVCPARC